MTVVAINPVPNRPAGSAPRSIADILADFDHITEYINNSIVPALNASNPAYGDMLQQGVISGGSVNRDSGTQVTVAAGTGWITVSGVLTRVTWPESVISAIPAGPSNGRVDQIIVSSAGVVSRLAGSTPGASITDLDDANATSSRAAVPDGSMRLWEAVVETGGISSTAGTKLRDRRAWAKGANAEATIGATITTASASMVDMTGLSLRVECGSTRPFVVFMGVISDSSTPASEKIQLLVDGVSSGGALGHGIQPIRTTSGAEEYRYFVWRPVVSVGSHLFKLQWLTGGGGTVSLVAGTSNFANPRFIVTEDLRPVADNGTA